MKNETTIKFIKESLDNMPSDWIKLTTHRLDIYNEQRAKAEFLEKFENLVSTNNLSKKTLSELPTAFDYIRLGHPLSCILEWVIAKSQSINVENVISFSSQVMPLFAILRKNLLNKTRTQIIYKCDLPKDFDPKVIERVYGYKFDLVEEGSVDETKKFDGSRILLTELSDALEIELKDHIDFVLGLHSSVGSVVLVNDDTSKDYISEIQHVRRRESIAMTPRDSLAILENISSKDFAIENVDKEKKKFVLNTIKEITSTTREAALGSCGLSIQYSIMMGLIHHAQDKYPGKDIKFIVPPNCYGGTNDQARRVAACIENVEIVDLPVDGGRDMATSVEEVLEEVSKTDSIPYIIAEIPTNPRVEIPELERLKESLGKIRKTSTGERAISPVFILDQTFCPNVKFLGKGDYLDTVKTISYVSGSKFPSGGLCTAGYCVANDEAAELMDYVDKHLSICANEATAYQVEVLATQMPSMNKRISDAYKNTRGFVNFIEETLPEAKINFVSQELASLNFTPSVFSLDLPTKGNDHQEREDYKRALNLKLINLMIKEIPSESKYCVSYGQLKGCYWTIPATSTQGTTKEGDKDYIVRVSLSPEFNLQKHCEVFAKFCKDLEEVEAK